MPLTCAVAAPSAWLSSMASAPGSASLEGK